ncbi:hypothetical protein E2C01_018811 [Portunus trituberculatus]|uniref:Uncharacterized protein n=1 Tax=Portunus trituberculatus TaxID=210409 RepID=A0A5B7DX70_PORTR|nr:hypothetical protein [Portunus trituberculatus]
MVALTLARSVWEESAPQWDRMEALRETGQQKIRKGPLDCQFPTSSTPASHLPAYLCDSYPHPYTLHPSPQTLHPRLLTPGPTPQDTPQHNTNKENGLVETSNKQDA